MLHLGATPSPAAFNVVYSSIWAGGVAVAHSFERTSSNQEVGGLMPVLLSLHALVSWGKILNPKLALLIEKVLFIDALYECVWKWVNGRLEWSPRLEKHFINTDYLPFTINVRFGFNVREWLTQTWLFWTSLFFFSEPLSL